MKVFFLFIVVVFNLFGFEKVPNWYLKDSYILYSFGYGKDIEDAKKLALDRINKDYNKSIIIDDIQLDKNGSLDNISFVRISYNTRNLQNRISKYLKGSGIDLGDENSSYLIKTPFFKKIDKKIDITIKGKYLFLDNNKSFFIKNDEFKLFLYENKSNNIDIKIDDNITINKNFFISLNTKKDGFLNLIQIVDDIDIQVMFSNLKVKKDKNIIFPNFKYSDGLNFNKETSFWLIALLCDSKNNFDDFNSLMFYDKTKKFKFDKLFNILDSCEYTIIKKRVLK